MSKKTEKNRWEISRDADDGVGGDRACSPAHLTRRRTRRLTPEPGLLPPQLREIVTVRQESRCSPLPRLRTTLALRATPAGLECHQIQPISEHEYACGIAVEGSDILPHHCSAQPHPSERNARRTHAFRRQLRLARKPTIPKRYSRVTITTPCLASGGSQTAPIVHLRLRFRLRAENPSPARFGGRKSWVVNSMSGSPRFQNRNRCSQSACKPTQNRMRREFPSNSQEAVGLSVASFQVAEPLNSTKRVETSKQLHASVS
jgi:hypothetical protein